MKFLFIILALASGWYCQAQETILKGHIRNYNGEEIFILCRETEFQDTLQVDASGHFAWSPKLTEGQIYTLNVKDYERERIEVNLTPGNQSEIELTLLPDKKMIVKFWATGLRKTNTAWFSISWKIQARGTLPISSL